MKIVLVDKSDIEVTNVTQSLNINDDKIRLSITCKNVEDILAFSKRFSEENTKIIHLVKDGSVIKTYDGFIFSSVNEQISDRDSVNFVNVDLYKDIVEDTASKE